jgi:hypothetical protein
MAYAKGEHDDDQIGGQLAPDMMEVESQESPPDQDPNGSTDPLGTPLSHEPQGFNWITAEFTSLRTRVENIEGENKFYKSLIWQMNYDIMRLKGYLKERDDEIAGFASVFQELHQRLTHHRAFEDTSLPPVGYERQDLGDFKQTMLG